MQGTPRPGLKVLFLHGYGSDPDGIRPMYLNEHGYDVSHPALPDDDFPESVRIAQLTFEESVPDVIVGSSRGGAVAMNMDSRDVPLVLVAPAWKTWGEAARVKPAAVILHSENDDVVPIEHSRELIKNSGLAGDQLVVVGRDHRMDDAAAFAAMVEAVERISTPASPASGASHGPGQSTGQSRSIPLSPSNTHRQEPAG
jgi:predicted esterase